MIRTPKITYPLFSETPLQTHRIEIRGGGSRGDLVFEEASRVSPDKFFSRVTLPNLSKEHLV